MPSCTAGSTTWARRCCSTARTPRWGCEAYIDKLHRDGRLVWANAIIYNYKTQLSAGHSDDISAAGDPEGGWGWLADRGYDLIQTDWPLMMRLYLEETGRRFKK